MYALQGSKNILYPCKMFVLTKFPCQEINGPLTHSFHALATQGLTIQPYFQSFIYIRQIVLQE